MKFYTTEILFWDKRMLDATSGSTFTGTLLSSLKSNGWFHSLQLFNCTTNSPGRRYSACESSDQPNTMQLFHGSLKGYIASNYFRHQRLQLIFFRQLQIVTTLSLRPLVTELQKETEVERRSLEQGPEVEVVTLVAKKKSVRTIRAGTYQSKRYRCVSAVAAKRTWHKLF